MNYRDNTKDERTKELQKLQQEDNSLKTLYKKYIAEHKRSNDKLRESETRYRELFNNINNGVAIYDVKENGDDFIFKEINRAGERMDGNRKEDIIGKSIYKVRPGIIEFGLLEVFKRVFATGIPEQYPSRFYMDEKLHGWYTNFVYRLPSGEIVAVYDNINEIKKAEEELIIEKENFRHSLDDSPLGIRIATIEGNTIYANKTLLDFYGYDSLEELQKTPIKDRYTPESYQKAKERKRLRKRGDLSATDYEISIVRKNGEIRHLHVLRKEVLWDGVRQFQVICNDVTERKRAEEEREVALTKYKTLFNCFPFGITVSDDDGKILESNQTAEKLLGESQDKHIKRDIDSPEWHIIRQDGTPMPPDEYASVRALKEKRIVEKVAMGIVKPDNTTTWISVTAAPLPLQGYGVVIVYEEITERTLAEETIRILAKFPSENPDPVLRVDRNGQLLFANDASYKLLTWKIQKGKKTPSVLQKIIADALKEGIVKKIDIEHNQRVISFKVVPVLEAGYANLYGQDITERKQAEEEIRKSAKLMEDLHMHLNEIREEEHAITSREIHDQIGQSLTALKLDLNWMHKYINTDPEVVAKIQGMIELITDTIKAVQRISSELRPGILDDLGLAAAIEWYCDEFEKRTSVKCNLKLDDSTVGDSQKNLVFFRVLQEALTNVIRHANALSVAVKLHHAQKGTTLTIHDNGIGIPEEKIKSYKSLGLIGIRERVRLFNGNVDISSKKGEGTKLKIFIPS
jgi:PAS domain S-box-containing protein